MHDDLDTPVHGALAIARVLNLRNKRGELDPRKAYYGVEQGHIDADKFGKRGLVSTPRRLLTPITARAAGKPVAALETSQESA
jgi:hypothetical protein